MSEITDAERIAHARRMIAECRELLESTNHPRKVVTVGAPGRDDNGDPFEDWPLAQYGTAERGDDRFEVHVTTDHVRASETRGDALDDATWDAQSPQCALMLCRALAWALGELEARSE